MHAKLQSIISRIKRVCRRIWSKIHPVDELKLLCDYDSERFMRGLGFKHASSLPYLSTVLKIRAHGIDKGFSMPNFHCGFGLQKIPLLADYMHRYEQAGGKLTSPEYRFCLCVLEKYRHVHSAQGYELPDNINHILNELLSASDGTQVVHKKCSRADFFASSHGTWPEFCKARHSVRAFTGPADLDKILEAVDMARSAPSSCNRQYIKAHIYENRELAVKVLALQSGNAGFGEEAQQVIVITADMNGIMWPTERHDLWFNAGLFTMNLLNSLFYLHVGACPLLWLDSRERNHVLQQMADIPANEVVTALIVCGEVYEEFVLANSDRRPVHEYVTVHE